MTRSLLVSGTVALMLVGCTGAFLNPRFRGVGKVGGPDGPKAHAQPEQVEVFQGTSPEGFTLANNELEVEQGYGHHVLGYIELRPAGACDLGEKDSYSFGSVTKALQKAAASRGGNAVIYASIHVTDEDKGDCRRISDMAWNDEKQRIAGSGWIVVLGQAPGDAASKSSPESSAPAVSPESAEATLPTQAE